MFQLALAKEKKARKVEWEGGRERERKGRKGRNK